MVLGRDWLLWQRVTIIKKLIQWHLQRSTNLFESLNGRNSVPIFYPRDVAAKETRALFYIALRKPLLLTDDPNSFSNFHAPPPDTCELLYYPAIVNSRW